MRSNAEELNRVFATTEWTPRNWGFRVQRIAGIDAASPLSADQDFGVGALDNARPNRYSGPSVLDRGDALFIAFSSR
jgi:hypothetical protein